MKTAHEGYTTRNFLAKCEMPASGDGWYFHGVVRKHCNLCRQPEPQLLATQTHCCSGNVSSLCSLYGFPRVSNTYT